MSTQTGKVGICIDGLTDWGIVGASLSEDCTSLRRANVAGCMYFKKADIMDGKQNIMHIDNSQQQANYLVNCLL